MIALVTSVDDEFRDVHRWACERLGPEPVALLIAVLIQGPARA